MEMAADLGLTEEDFLSIDADGDNMVSRDEVFNAIMGLFTRRSARLDLGDLFSQEGMARKQTHFFSFSNKILS